jgi:hypothetical protein
MPVFATGLFEASPEPGGQIRLRAPGWQAWLAHSPSIPGRHDNGLLLEAASVTSAQSAFDLIWASFGVVEASGPGLANWPVIAEVPAVVDGTALCRHDLVPMVRPPMSLHTSGVWRAARLAARAARKKQWVYAVHELGLSQALCSLHPMDLNPSHWRHGPAVSARPMDHVALAQAVLLAYSVIEQLGLEVRANRESPSRPSGRWNPTVRSNLEGRLTEAGVDISDPIIWIVRGTTRNVTRGRPTTAVGRASWAWGRVRDEEVQLVDAIADVSWLRSQVAAHRLGDAAASLAPYDVFNAQLLARRLLRESLKLWNRTA